VTKTAGIKVFLMISENESALAETNSLVKDRSRKSGSISERSLTKLALRPSLDAFGQRQLFLESRP